MRSRPFARVLVPILAACAVVIGPGSTAWAADVCDPPAPMPVPTSRAVVGTGTAASCTEAAFRSAITHGGHVTFQCGGAVTIAVTSQLSVAKTTVIDGAGKITLDGRGRNRILVARNGTALSVRNLHLVNGAAASSMDGETGIGGAVAGLYRSRVEIIGSTFAGNKAGRGGGAVAVWTDSRLTIRDSVFTGNSSWYGGAVYSLLSPLSVVDSTFTGNSTTTTGGLGDGGAIGTDGGAPIGKGGTIQICGSVISHNTGHGSGGGAYIWAYALDRIIVERTTFEANEAKANGRDSGGIGGAARLSIGPTDTGKTGTLVVRQSSMLSNSSGGNGGGFYLDCAPTCDITNSTFYGNSSAAYGGAIFGDGHHSDNVTFANNKAGGHGGAIFGKNFVLRNAVLVGNSAGNPWGQAMTCSTVGKGDHVLQWLTSSRDSSDCVSGVAARNPKLAKPADNGGPTWTMMPGAGSPVLNAGSGCETRDQRGQARQKAKCDLGAVQRVVVAPAHTTAPPATPTASASPGASAAPTQAMSNLGADGPAGQQPLSSKLPAILLGTGVAAATATGVLLWFLRRRNAGRRPAPAHRRGSAS